MLSAARPPVFAWPFLTSSVCHHLAPAETSWHVSGDRDVSHRRRTCSVSHVAQATSTQNTTAGEAQLPAHGTSGTTLQRPHWSSSAVTPVPVPHDASRAPSLLRSVGTVGTKNEARSEASRRAWLYKQMRKPGKAKPLSPPSPGAVASAVSSSSTAAKQAAASPPAAGQPAPASPVNAQDDTHGKKRGKAGWWLHTRRLPDGTTPEWRRSPGGTKQRPASQPANGGKRNESPPVSRRQVSGQHSKRLSGPPSTSQQEPAASSLSRLMVILEGIRRPANESSAATPPPTASSSSSPSSSGTAPSHGLLADVQDATRQPASRARRLGPPTNGDKGLGPGGPFLHILESAAWDTSLQGWGLRFPEPLGGTHSSGVQTLLTDLGSDPLDITWMDDDGAAQEEVPATGTGAQRRSHGDKPASPPHRQAGPTPRTEATAAQPLTAAQPRAAAAQLERQAAAEVAATIELGSRGTSSGIYTRHRLAVQQIDFLRRARYQLSRHQTPTPNDIRRVNRLLVSYINQPFVDWWDMAQVVEEFGQYMDPITISCIFQLLSSRLPMPWRDLPYPDSDEDAGEQGAQPGPPPAASSRWRGRGTAMSEGRTFRRLLWQLMSHARDQMQHFTPGPVCTTLLGLSRLQIRARGLIRQLCDVLHRALVDSQVRLPTQDMLAARAAAAAARDLEGQSTLLPVTPQSPPHVPSPSPAALLPQSVVQPRHIAITMCSLVELRPRLRTGFLRAVARGTLSRLQLFKPNEVAIIPWAFKRLGCVPSPMYLAWFCHLSQSKLQWLKPREAAMLLAAITSFSTARQYHPPNQWVVAVMASAGTSAALYGPDHVATLLLCTSRLFHKPWGWVLDALLLQARRTVHLCSPHDAALLVNGLARLGRWPGPDFAQAYVQHFLLRIGEASADDVSRFMTCLASLCRGLAEQTATPDHQAPTSPLATATPSLAVAPPFEAAPSKLVVRSRSLHPEVAPLQPYVEAIAAHCCTVQPALTGYHLVQVFAALEGLQCRPSAQFIRVLEATVVGDAGNLPSFSWMRLTATYRALQMTPRDARLVKAASFYY